MEKQIEDKDWLDKVKEALKNLNKVFDELGKTALGIAPAETAHEKARRFRDWLLNECPSWEHMDAVKSACGWYEQALAELATEIDRLKSEAWTDEDMWDARGQVLSSFGVADFSGWLVARRAAKAKE